MGAGRGGAGSIALRVDGTTADQLRLLFYLVMFGGHWG